VGQGWEYASLYDPMVRFEATRSDESYVLMFFLFTLVFMVSGVILYLFRYIISFLFPLKYVNFVDLCSVANISVFMFDEKFHGYYIHGESPANSSDVTLDTLKRALDNEGNGQYRNRGLTDKNPKLQTFEFYLPYSERKLFDEVFEENLVKSSASKDENITTSSVRRPKQDFIYKSKDIGIFEDDFRKIVTKKDELDYYLVNKINEIKRNPNQFISDVTSIYGFTRLPPDSIIDLNQIRLVADRFMNFTRVLLSDLDFDIIWIIV
jgi:hypothetical protein